MLYSLTRDALLTWSITRSATWNKLGNVNEGYFQQTWAKYYDTLVETDGTWKFQSRNIELLFGPLSANLTDGGL